jgi:hypothetical protein
VDIKAAYDLVNHKILINKLKNKRINEALLNVIKIIYSNARIVIDPLYGEINFNKGVLQGSILSSLLFNFYKE